jgi:hypothetical protein
LASLWAACGESGEAVDAADGLQAADFVEATGPDFGSVCKPDCSGRECGDDGCGAYCGECTSDQECVDDGYCAYVEYWDCTGLECGPDRYGFTWCGDCPAGRECEYGRCIRSASCCEGLLCGPDRCAGEPCGTCEYGTCSLDQTRCDCTPACDGKACGADGCGGSCGTCEGCDAVPWCTADGQCACDLPPLFSKASRLSALYVPATATETGADVAEALPGLAGSSCLDVSGDGLPDNGLGALRATLAGFGVDGNAEIQKAFGGHGLNLLLDLGSDPGRPHSPFTLSAYLGQPAPSPGEYWVDLASFVDGEPMLHFEGAEIVDGSLDLGLLTFPLGLVLSTVLASSGLPALDVTIDRARLIGTVDGVIDDAGAAFRAGTLSGALFKADVDRALWVLRKWCAETPTPPADTCGYIQMADLSLIETFLSWDLEIADCGKTVQLYDSHDPLIVVGEEPNCQAVSACAFWAAEKARIIGLVPAQ